MKKISLAIAGVAMLALAGCDRGSEQEQLGDNVQTNAVAPTEDLNALSEQAANIAAEAQQLENQSAELNQEAETTPAPADNAAGPETEADENIQGM
jgi:type 1 fimbria pilin